MLLKVMLLAPIVVLVTFRAVPVVAAMVLFDPVTLTVPPPVARKPVPEVVGMVSAELGAKLIIVPVLLVSLTAVFAPVESPIVGLLKLIVPPELLAMFSPA